MTTQLYTENDTSYSLNSCNFYDQINQLTAPLVPHFLKISKSHLRFHLFFSLLLFIELSVLVTCFSIFVLSSTLALMLSSIFLTVFAYFTLKIYFDGKKPAQLKGLRDGYIDRCKEFLGYQEGVPEDHITLANACCKLATALQGIEYQSFKSRWFKFLNPYLEKFSCWWLWNDVFMVKELMLKASIDEHIKLVKCEPTNLELHTALANAYVMLSGLYVDPRKIEGYDDDRWLPPTAFDKSIEEKFRSTAKKAIEEFKILNEFAPNDPWIHIQLAYSYHDLQMPMEEIREYETVIRLRPDDRDALYKLGVLYFQQGMNADGLRVYEALKHAHYKKAESLIQHYGAYRQ